MDIIKRISFYALFILTGCSLFEGPEGKISLLDVSDEPAGQNCSNGGIKISAGIDSNENGVLDTNEITSTKYVCGGANGFNGQNGSNGINSLITTTQISAGDICPGGGIRVDSGKDLNKNAILDISEIEVTKYICNGIDGLVDKQIRLKLPEAATFNGSQVTSDQQSNLHKFNIDYFVGVDSVIYAIWSSVPDAGNSATIELYNLTDNSIINGSAITTVGSGPIIYQSSNIKNGFPHKEIAIGIRLKGNVPGQAVNATSGYLYLYRK